MAKAKNTNLGDARKAKKDEFYTQLSDIERELRHYRHHFAGKVVYLNCDDPRVSNFFHYFSFNFEKLGLKRLIATCYRNQEVDLFSRNDSDQAIWLEYDGDRDGNGVPDFNEIGVQKLEGDGSFLSDESVELLKQADIVVTNPPFSLIREYVGQLMEHDKQFVILGNHNALSYKEIFPLIQQDRMWLGYTNGEMKFRVPEHYESREFRYWVDDNGDKWRSIGNGCWFTNLDISKRHEDLVLYKTYDPAEYQSFDNFDAIVVPATAEIPMDYDGLMGVPVTFLVNYNPEQFEIVGITKTWFGAASKTYPKQIQVDPSGKQSNVSKLNDGAAIKVTKPPVGKTYYLVGDDIFVQKYPRILIRRKASRA